MIQEKPISLMHLNTKITNKLTQYQIINTGKQGTEDTKHTPITMNSTENTELQNTAGLSNF